VKLLFLTVELERIERVDDFAGLHSSGGSALHDRLSARVVICLAAAVSVFLAAAAGWSIIGLGADFTSNVPRWLPISMYGPQSEARMDQLDITSVPDKATVLIDGHERENTPLSVAVASGSHILVLKHPTAVDAQRDFNFSSDTHVNVTMFERRPDAVQLKPAYPGATVNDATFLDDGRLALTMGLPGQAADRSNLGSGILNEAWTFDPASGLLAPFPTPSSNPHAAIVAVSPDGNRVAYAQPLQTVVSPGKRGAEVVVADSDGALRTQAFALPPPDGLPGPASASGGQVEEIHDVTWARLVGGALSVRWLLAHRR
jgi:hypothetical protein